MHQDHPPDRDPIVHVSQRPELVAQANGDVRAFYPGEDWFVTGATGTEAIELLKAEAERRMQDPEYVARHWELTARHLEGRESTPGFEVRTISREQYADHAADFGDRLRRAGDREA